MRWVVIFDDAPQMMDHRKKQGKKHADYARANKNEILIVVAFVKPLKRALLGGCG